MLMKSIIYNHCFQPEAFSMSISVPFGNQRVFITLTMAEDVIGIFSVQSPG